MTQPSAGQAIVAATIVRSKLDAIVAEMEAVLVNTAYSPNVSVSRQCAAAVITEQGEVVAVSSAAHLYPLAFTSALIVDRYQYNLAGEDVLLTNDPYGGGTRVQNFTAVAPVSDGESIGMYVAVCAQTEDFGGDLRGNLNPAATEIWAEGARCPPVKIVREGRSQRDLLKTLALNSRNPVAFELDVQAMIAAANIGRRRLLELFERHGRAELAAIVQSILDFSERRTRALLGQVPAGTYSGEASLEHDGQGRRQLPIKASLSFANGGVRADFTGTAPQSTSFVNATRAAAATHVLLPLVTALRGEVPLDAGTLRRIELVLPEGSLVNPTLPAPTGLGEQHVGHEVASAVTLALTAALPDQAARVTANSMLLFSTYRATRHGQTLEQIESHDLSNFVQGGTDGSPERDGWGMPGAAARVPLPSIELYQTERGGRIEALEYTVDSAGAGCQRGSPGTSAVISLPRMADGVLQVTSMVVKDGAREHANSILLHGDNGAREIDGVVVNQLLDTDVRIVLTMEGGRGRGDPLDRAPACVARDVHDGLVSMQTARDIYGVILDAAGGGIDESATERRRAELRAEAGLRGGQTHG
jgi:N-methylhydantoinase B